MFVNNQECGSFYNDLLHMLKRKTKSRLMIDSMYKMLVAYLQKILHSFSCLRILAREP